MARRRVRERTESLKEEKEERKGQVLDEDKESERETERERQSHLCKKDCFCKTTTVWPCGRLGGAAYQQSFRLFNILLCTSNP